MFHFVLQTVALAAKEICNFASNYNNGDGDIFTLLNFVTLKHEMKPIPIDL